MLELIKITRTQVLDDTGRYSRFIDDPNSSAKIEVIDFNEISNIKFDTVVKAYDYSNSELVTIAKKIQLVSYCIRDMEHTYELKLSTGEKVDLNVYNIGFQVLVEELQDNVNIAENVVVGE